MAAKKVVASSDALCVFQDAERRTCIRLSVDKSGVEFIPFRTDLMDICKISNKDFEIRYIIPLPEYPVKKAAELYLGALWLEMSKEAKKRLEKICSTKSFNYDPLTLPESIMTKATTKPATSKTAGAKTTAAPAAKGAATKAAPAPAAKPTKVAAKAPAPAAKPAAKAAPAPKASAKDAKPKVAAAAPAKAGKKPAANKPNETAKIKVIAKANPYREGTKAAATFDLFKTSATVGDFFKAVAKAPEDYDAGYLRYSSRDGHISVG